MGLLPLDAAASSSLPSPPAVRYLPTVCFRRRFLRNCNLHPAVLATVLRQSARFYGFYEANCAARRERENDNRLSANPPLQRSWHSLAECVLQVGSRLTFIDDDSFRHGCSIDKQRNRLKRFPQRGRGGGDFVTSTKDPFKVDPPGCGGASGPFIATTLLQTYVCCGMCFTTRPSFSAGRCFA